MKKKMIIGTAIIGTGLGVYLITPFFQEKKVVSVAQDKQDHRLKKITEDLKIIFQLKPNLKITKETVCKFGGNCVDGTDKRFTKLGFTEISNIEDFENYLMKLKEKRLLDQTIVPIRRTVIMLKYALKTKTYPKTNGTMNADLFNQL